DDINLAVEAAQAAFSKWSKTTKSIRANIMYRIADILESRLKEFAEAEVRDQGKTITFATKVDIDRSVYNFRYFAGYILHMEEKASFIVDGRAFSYVKKTPPGVAGLISPVSRTASGLKIYSTASMYLKKVSLELGGKNANIIFEDCDFEKAVATSIKSSFSNQGEICLCGSRIFVQSSIYQKFLDAFVPKARNMIVGDPNDPKTEVGALVSQSHMEKVLGYIELAKQEGGVIECGGGRKHLQGELRDGYFVEPTVIT
ncbi:9500_t:CDS:2, partial [Racocetra fulgida]